MVGGVVGGGRGSVTFDSRTITFARNLEILEILKLAGDPPEGNLTFRDFLTLTLRPYPSDPHLPGDMVDGSKVTPDPIRLAESEGG